MSFTPLVIVLVTSSKECRPRDSLADETNSAIAFASVLGLASCIYAQLTHEDKLLYRQHIMEMGCRPVPLYWYLAVRNCIYNRRAKLQSAEYSAEASGSTYPGGTGRSYTYTSSSPEKWSQWSKARQELCTFTGPGVMSVERHLH